MRGRGGLCPEKRSKAIQSVEVRQVDQEEREVRAKRPKPTDSSLLEHTLLVISAAYPLCATFSDNSQRDVLFGSALHHPLGHYR